MFSLVRLVLSSFLLLAGALLARSSDVLGWVTTPKSTVTIASCQVIVEAADPGEWCYTKDGMGIAGADSGDIGHRIEIVRVTTPPGPPGHPDAAAYTWSTHATFLLLLGVALVVAGVVALAWPVARSMARRLRRTDPQPLPGPQLPM
jgi:hypothetical protein